MPSETPKQARLMAARAHGAKFPMAKKIPLKVAKEFNAADKGTGILKKKKKKQDISKQGYIRHNMNEE